MLTKKHIRDAAAALDRAETTRTQIRQLSLTLPA